MNKADEILAHGFFQDDLPVGRRFRTMNRTIFDADLVNYVNLTWFTEELFVDMNDTSNRAMTGRIVPGGLVYAFAEGLITPSIQFTGLAFLGMDLDVKGPTVVGDTIHVDVEVIESRATKEGRRGVVRTRNTVTNQRDEAILIYTPLRLVRRRAKAA